MTITKFVICLVSQCLAGVSTHVLDASIGKPGSNMKIDLFNQTGDNWIMMKSL